MPSTSSISRRRADASTRARTRSPPPCRRDRDLFALFSAAALITGCGLLLQTGLSGTVAPERYAAAPIIVSGDQNAHGTKSKNGKNKIKSKPLSERVWVAEDVAGTIRSLPSVHAVVTEVTFPASLLVHGQPVTRPHGEPSLGHGWESAPLTPFTLRAGRAPTSSGEVVIDAALADRNNVHVGSTVIVQTTTAPQPYHVVGIVAPPRQRTACPRSRRSSSRHPTRASWRVTRVLLRARRVAGTRRSPLHGRGERSTRGQRRAGQRTYRSRSWLRGISPDQRHEGPADQRCRRPRRHVAAGRVLVLVATIGLTIERRRRELGLLRALGSTPRQLRSLVGREALAVGVVASVPGCFVGVVVGACCAPGWSRPARSLRTCQWFEAHFPSSLPSSSRRSGPGSLHELSVGARARIQTAIALTEAEVPAQRIGLARAVAGALLLTLGIALVAVLRHLDTEPAATPVSFLASLVWVSAITLLAPPLVRLTGATLAVATPGSAFATLELAAENVRVELAGARRLRRLYRSPSRWRAPSSSRTPPSRTPHRTRSNTACAPTTCSAPPRRAATDSSERVRRTVGVDAATEIVRSEARGTDLAKYSVQGVTPTGLHRTMDLDVRDGTLRELANDTTAISTTASARSGAGVGSAHPVPRRRHPATLTVIAVYARGLGFPDITLTHDLLAAHVDNPLDDVVLVHGSPGLQHDLQRALQDDGDIQVVAEKRAGHDALESTDDSTNRVVESLMLILIVGFAVIAVVNTLVMSTADRVHEFAALRRIGTTRSQIRWLVRWEASLLAFLGIAAGAAVGLTIVTAFSVGMTRSTPYILPSADCDPELRRRAGHRHLGYRAHATSSGRA